MSDKKNASPCKPPVPARPKNLVVLNSKHLPKPPETFLSENLTNIIKDLNLNGKDEENERKKRIRNAAHRFENSDSEEDTYGYLEPASLSPSSSTGTVGKDKRTLTKTLTNPTADQENQSHSNDENSKIGDILRKVISRNGSGFAVAKPIGANLGRRLTHEMADFGFNFKRRLRRAVNTQQEKLDAILETSEQEDSKPQIPPSQRPLPSLPLPPVETKSVVATMPWYKNVDRKGGEEILRNGVDGYFLVRPSSNAETYLTLTLWHNSRVYNIPIRKRKDGKFALGTPKTHEQCFDSVEYLVKNYQSEKLVLYSNGLQTGKTLLTTYPP